MSAGGPRSFGDLVGSAALKHRALVLLVMTACVLGGILAARTLASGIYPEVEFPRIAVIVRQGDAPPDVVLTAVTRPIEAALTSVQGVERVRSRTIRGGADIQLIFSAEMDMWRALQLVDAALNDARGQIPLDTRIRVERITPVSFPVLSLNLSGAMDPRDLRDIAEYTLRPALARVHGVGRVEVLGGDVREMEVIVDPERAAAAHLSVGAIAAAVARAVPLVAVGRFEQDHAMTTALASAEALGVDDLATVPIGVDMSGRPVPLRDVASVEEGAEDRFYRASGPKGEGVIVTIARLEGASTPEVVDGVLAALHELGPTLPAGAQVEPVYDQGLLVGESIASVRDAIILGIVLCLLVLGAFLRDVRAGLVASLAVPATLAATFVAMAAMHQTLNLMSLGGMAVSIGLVVDDAIVIVEAIAREMELGATPQRAARDGTSKLAAAVVGTTITTVIVFVPLALLGGIVGAFFSALATTLTAAVVISLLVALFVVPVVAARVMRPRPARPRSRAVAAIVRMVRWSSRRAWLGITMTLAAVAFVGFAVVSVPTGFMPACDEGAFVLDYLAPAGASLTDTASAAARIEQILRETPEVETFSRRTGAQINAAVVTLPSKGDFVVRLRPPPRRHVDEVIAEIRERVEREVPMVHTEYVQLIQDMLNDLSDTPRPIEVKVFGEDYAVLESLAAQVEARVTAVVGVVDVYGGIERPSATLVVKLNRDEVARMGWSPQEIAHELSAAMLGTVVANMRRFDRLIGIRVRYPDAVRFDPERLVSLPLSSPMMAMTATWTAGGPGRFTLGAVAKLQRDESPTQLRHEGLQPVVAVTADHEGRDLGGVVRDIEASLADLALPPGYRIEIGGQHEAQQRTAAHMLVVGVAGIMLVLVVLVAQFAALRPAIAVLLGTPLALVGALAALWITDTPLDTSSAMGCVLLVGLCVKNGILLVEVAESSAESMPYEDALALAAERRSRPIAMTTLATLAGLLPLALGIGSGAELQQPLAIAVLGGLLTSAFGSLVVLPSLGAWLHHLGRER